MTQLWSVDCAGISHAGLVRKVNEDAWLARPEAGIFAVADGMGGHQRGDLASRKVIDALAALPPPRMPGQCGSVWSWHWRPSIRICKPRSRATNQAAPWWCC